ncbi:MAG: AAA family ATPase [Acidobacteria bacterium]|nr:AAA family ATPase [Acidobacteriota bacterium]
MQPPSTPGADDQPLYEAFYGLREQPFALTTDPRFLFMGDAHRRAYEELLTGLRRREGLMILTGDTGMGKTTLCRAVINALGPRTFSALILNPYMSDAEVLRVILRDFGLVTRDEIRNGAFSKADVPQLLDTLEGFLKSLVDLNSFAVVIIDEAQSLSAKVLDQVRVLGGIESDGRRLLQIILVGQPDLLTTIRSDAMKALDDRISRRAVLGPLPPADVDDYIQHRLTVAGGKDTIAFTAESVNLVAELTRGVPRRINLLCDRTLEAGRVEGTSLITPEIVQRAHQAASGQAPIAPTKVVRATPEAVAPAVAADRFDELALNLETGLDFPDSPAGHDDAPLMFGQAEEAAPSRGRFWVLVFLAMILLAGGAVSYAGYAYFKSDPGMPVLPQAPIRRVDQPPTLSAPPGEHEERYLMKELERLNPGWRPGGGG